VVTGLFGGAFDPPHNGHLAVARAALEQLGLDRLVVLVSQRPGHRTVVSGQAERVALARAAFADLPRTTVELDPFPRTVDLLRARPELDDPVVIVGTDQLADFERWKEPDEVLRLARLAVAARPGVDEARVETALRSVSRPERVLRFDVEQLPVASSELRGRAARGEPIDAFVPPEVATLVRDLGLYASGEG
jgi:nicotinate-nucleotide adenylyltransferase